MRIPLVLALLASLAAAQTPEAAKKIRVEGNVTSLAGEPVKRATVRMQPNAAAPIGAERPATYSETTDDAGKFVFEDVAPGRYMLSAEKSGFINQRYGATENNSTPTLLTFTEGQTVSNLAIKMTPQGIISGRVVDREGDPVNGAQVQAMRSVFSRGRRTLTSVGGLAVTTNDQGDYRIANLPPGRYYISASERPRPILTSASPRASAAAEANVKTFYPNERDAARAAPVDVAAGSELRGVEVRMRREKVYWVRGKAVDASGAVPSSTALRFGPKDANGIDAILMQGTTFIQGDGAFEYRNLAPGTYVLQSVAGTVNRVPTPVVGRMEIAITDSNIDNVVFRLSSSAVEFTGTVTYESGDPKANEPLATLTPIPASTRAGLPPVSSIIVRVDPIDGTTSIGAGQVQPDGKFQIAGIPPGKYDWTFLRLPDGVYVKSARFSGQDVTRSVIDNTAGTGGTLDFVLSSKAADISGTVHNDQGERVVGGHVTLWPFVPNNGETEAGVRRANTDKSGAFKIPNLAPGDYYVAAFEDLENGLDFPDFLNHFTADATSLKLDESGHGTRDLKVVPLQKIATEIAKLP